MKITGLLFLLRNDQILLAMKKRGTGEGKWNGVGGKVNPNETIEAATIRECQEEIGVTPTNLKKVAWLEFKIPSQDFHNQSHVFVTTEWTGEPVETEEMRPQWFALSEIPYAEMWSDDRLWLPKVLADQTIAARFLFNEHEQVSEHEITQQSFPPAQLPALRDEAQDA